MESKPQTEMETTDESAELISSAKPRRKKSITLGNLLAIADQAAASPEALTSVQTPADADPVQIPQEEDTVRKELTEISTTIGRRKKPLNWQQTVSEYCKRHRVAVSAILTATAAVIVFVAICKDGFANNLLNAGLAQMSKQHYKKAIRSFNEAIFLTGNDQIYLYRGISYNRLGNSVKAFNDLTKILDQEPNNVQALDERAIAGFQLGKNESVVNDYTQLFALAPAMAGESPSRLLNLGAAYMALGKSSQALEQFDKCIATFGHEGSAYVERAICYEHLGKLEQALADYNAAIKLSPDYVKALVKRGRCYQLANDYVNDVVDFEHVLKIQPKNAAAYKYMGMHYAHFKQNDKALSALDTAIALNPADTEAYEEEVNCLALSGNTVEALATLYKLSTLPNFEPTAKYYEHCARLNEQANKLTTAIDCFHLAQKQDPGNAGFYDLQVADCYGKMHDYQQAAAATTQALDKNQNTLEALVKQGHYNWLAGNKISAMDDFAKALNLNQKYADTYLERSNCYLADGQVASAASDLETALSLNPKLIEAKTRLALCQSRMKQLVAEKKTVALKVPTPRSAVLKPKSTETSAQSDEKAPANMLAKKLDKMDFAQLMRSGDEAVRSYPEYAVAALSKAVTLQPDDFAARKHLFYALIACGKSGEALEQLVVLSKQENQSLAEDLALVKCFSGAPNNAFQTKAYEVLIGKYASDPSSLLTIAQTCYKGGLFDIAVESCDKGLSCTADLKQAQNFNLLRMACDKVRAGS